LLLAALALAARAGAEDVAVSSAAAASSDTVKSGPEVRLQLDAKGNTDAAQKLAACVRQKLDQTPDVRVVYSSGAYRTNLQAFDSGYLVAVGFVATKPSSGAEGAVYLLDQSLFVEHKSNLDSLCKMISDRIVKVELKPNTPDGKTTTDNPRFNLGIW
jgi:hypothetical protein